MNFHECMKLFYPETKIILYNQKNEVVLEGQVKDIRKECEKYHNVEVTFVSGRADTTGLKIWARYVKGRKYSAFFLFISSISYCF